MLFSSYQFLFFFVVVFGLYTMLNHKWQNRMLLLASYVFYGSWDWRFLSLIWISTIIDYACGLKIDGTSSQGRKRLFLWVSVCSNLLILGFFKYMGFFAENLQALLELLGMSPDIRVIELILPVGISFYTFQTMSYSIDIYRGLLKPTRNFLDFALFVAFFPQLLAGPIERAKNLLPQILEPRKISTDNIVEGSYLIFWGLFEKLFVADNLAKVIDPVFAAEGPYNGATVSLCLLGFAVQVFCDFDGYSNMARGLAKVMGFEIMFNFRWPLISTNPVDFWARWHISLYGWLRDYVYYPLAFGGKKRSMWVSYRAVMILMLLGGLWHGASWRFVLWGSYHGMLLVAYGMLRPHLRRLVRPSGRFAEGLWFWVSAGLMLMLIALGGVLFRADSVTQAYEMLYGIVFNFLPTDTWWQGASLKMLFFAWLALLVQYLQFRTQDPLAVLRLNRAVSALFCTLCFWLLILFGASGRAEFIYFQF